MTVSDPTQHLLQFCQRGYEHEHWDNLDLALTKARTGWLKNWLQEHLPDILDLQNTPEDHLKAREWDEKAKLMMSDRGLTTASQQKNRLTDIRNAIKTLDPHHPALADVGFTAEEWELINRPSEDKVSTRTTKFLTNPDAIINRANDLLSSREWNDLAAGLAVVTGRRCSEILKTANFTYKSAYSVIFTGAIKRRDEVPQLRFEIPTLVSAQKVIKVIAKLRDWVDTSRMSLTDVNNRYADAVIKACDRHFCDLVPPRDGEDNLYTHLFRAIYATIACHWYCPPHVPVLEYRAYIQGHFKILEEQNPILRRNLASDRHYFDYQISDGNGNVDGRLGIKLGLPSVEVLEAFQPQSPTVDGTSLPPLKPEPLLEAEAKPEPKSENQSLAQLTSEIKNLIKSDRYLNLLTGLMAATGRSPGELLKSGTFEKTNHPKQLRFSATGIGAKSSLLTLVEAHQVRAAIARLRHHSDVQSLLYLPPSEIDTHCLPSVLETMRQYLPFQELSQMQTAYSTYTHQSSSPSISSPQPKSPKTLIYHVYSDDKERLSAIAQQFNGTTQAATASTALDWAEVALHLAKRLQLQSPQQLVQWFEETASSTFHLQPLPRREITDKQSPQPEPLPVPLPTTPPTTERTERTERLEQMFIAQQQSLTQLTQAIAALVTTLNPSPQHSSPEVTPTTPKTPSKPTSPQPQPSTDTPKAATAHQAASRTGSAKSSSRASASIAKINRAIDAIMHYNNQTATTKKDKWLVAISALKLLTKCNQDLIKRVIQSRIEEIELHHATHELGEFHNSKGKSAPKITEVISLN